MEGENSSPNILNNQAMISSSLSHIVRLFILNDKQNIATSQRNYFYATEGSGQQSRREREWKGDLIVLLTDIRTRLKTKRPELFKSIKDNIDNNKLQEATEQIYEYLENDLKLTNISTIQEVRPTDISKRNKIKLGY